MFEDLSVYLLVLESMTFLFLVASAPLLWCTIPL